MIEVDLKHCGLEASTGPTRGGFQSAVFRASFDHFNGGNKDKPSVKPSVAAAIAINDRSTLVVFFLPCMCLSTVGAVSNDLSKFGSSQLIAPVS